MRIEGSRAILSFTHAGGGLISKGETLRGFTMAGEDGKFLPATATIEGKAVVVTSGQIVTPAAVRYNWAFNPDGNLYNRENLPATPFRSDQE